MTRESQPAPAAVPRDRRLDPGRMVSSLRHQNYRKFFFGQLISVMGTWTETVAQSFLVLSLTRSGTDLGLTLAARFLPILLFGPAGGLFADRRDKRRILRVTQALAGSVSAAFAVLTATHLIHMWLVYVLAMTLGLVNVFDNPARQSFIAEMVPADDLQNAVALNSVSMNLARVMSLWFLAWQGSTPIGGPLVGWIAQEAGARWSLVAGGVPTIACGLLALPVLARVDRKAADRKAGEIR